MAEHNVSAQSVELGHEASDLNPRRVALIGLALAVTIAVVLGITYAIFQYFHVDEARTQAVPSPLSYTREPTPEPRLEVKPGGDLKTVRAQEDAILKSYGWVDADKGIVRIPIDRAIEIVAERGLPARAAKSPAATAQKNQGRKEKR
jgi:hypothetical protein